MGQKKKKEKKMRFFLNETVKNNFISYIEDVTQTQQLCKISKFSVDE